MADACTSSNIPDGIDLVAYYVDGICAGGPVKGAQHVGISAIATNAGTVGDCEPDNPPPSTWVNWVTLRRAAGVDPTIYCADDSLSSFFDGYRWRDVRAAFQAAGVPEPHYWIAKPGATAIPVGAVAVQNQQGLEGDRYDLSLVADYWPGVDTEEPMLDPNDPIVQELRGKIEYMKQALDNVQAHTVPQVIGILQPAVTAIKTELDAVEGQIQSGQPADLTALKAELDALSRHVGVGTP